MEHGSHKVVNESDASQSSDASKPAADSELREPLADSHKPLDEIPANEGGKA